MARNRERQEIAMQAGMTDWQLAELEDGAADIAYTTMLRLADALDVAESDLGTRCLPAEFRAYHVQDVPRDVYQMLLEGYRPWHITRDVEQFRPGDRIHLREIVDGRGTGRWMRTTIAYVERLVDIAPAFVALTFDIGRYAGTFNDCESSGEG
jgi:hypothetical protein